MDYDQARRSTCSSCSVKEDLSNYWTPTLFYKAQNGSFHPVEQLGGALVYYLQRRGYETEPLFAFPKGFRMLAGDPLSRSYSDTKEQNAVNFACLNYSKAGPETPGFPAKNCPNGLRMQVFFPSCWDGKAVDSPDHKSHVAYPDGVNNGNCPKSHPVHLISIFYEVLFDVNAWKDEWYDGKWPFVLSTGDPTGYGFHGDFVNGWDIEVLQKAVDGCNSESGKVEDCPYLTFFDKDIQNDCYIPPRVDEQTTGWMPKLPGCNAVVGPPGPARPQTCDATTVIGDPKKYYTDMSAKGWSYDGCVIDKLDDRTLPIRFADDSMTIEMCVGLCASKGQIFAGLEYSRECFCGMSVAPNRKGDYKCMMPCVGNKSQICGDGQRLSIYKKGTIIQKGSSDPKVPATPVKLTTPSTTATTLTPTPTGNSANWIAKGCWLDPLKPRTLPTRAQLSEKTTNSGCIKYCQSKGFKYAGTEYGNECFCGNDISSSTKKPEADCNMACAGNAKEKCGGPGRLTLWEDTQNTKKVRSIPRMARDLYRKGLWV